MFHIIYYCAEILCSVGSKEYGMNENIISSLINTIEMRINNKVGNKKSIYGLQAFIANLFEEKIKKIPST